MKILHRVRVQYENLFSDGYPIDSAEAKQVIARCSDPYLRYPYRERCSRFRKLIRHYRMDLNGRVILDLGPGHCGFFRMCERLGNPAEMIAVDRDQAIVELARLWGYSAFAGNILDTKFMFQIPPDRVDLLFSKGSVDPCQIPNPEEWVETLLSRIKPDASIWFIPHYDIEQSVKHFHRVRETLAPILEHHRIQIEECPRWLGRYNTHRMELWRRP